MCIVVNNVFENLIRFTVPCSFKHKVENSYKCTWSKQLSKLSSLTQNLFSI